MLNAIMILIMYAVEPEILQCMSTEKDGLATYLFKLAQRIVMSYDRSCIHPASVNG
jgi:hypothetical protein